MRREFLVKGVGKAVDGVDGVLDTVFLLEETRHSLGVGLEDWISGGTTKGVSELIRREASREAKVETNRGHVHARSPEELIPKETHNDRGTSCEQASRCCSCPSVVTDRRDLGEQPVMGTAADHKDLRRNFDAIFTSVEAPTL